MPDHRRAGLPLAGVTVADLTRQLPGPVRRARAAAARRAGDEGRAARGRLDGPGGARRGTTRSTPARRSSPGTPRASRRPRRCSRRDVVLEGFRPGVWERLGVELPATAIVCSITGFGATGPHAGDAGHDLNYLGYAGVLADTAPSLPPVQIADLAAGAQGAVIEVLAALLERERTGLGARIVVSMTHGAHRLVSHRAGRRSAAAPAHGRRRLLPDLRDGGRPVLDRRRARAEVLAASLRAARAARPGRPGVRARAARARGAVPVAAAGRVAGPCSKARTRASGRC